MGGRGPAAAPGFNTCRLIAGQGPCVALIHGVGLDHHMWSAQAEALSDNFTVLRYDLPGHGNTPPRQGELDLDVLAAQLVSLLDEEDIQRAHVVGFSLGALIAQAFALAHSERLLRLVLISSVYDRGPAAREAVLKRLKQAERNGSGSIAQAALNRWFTDGYRNAHPQQVEKIEMRLRANTPKGFLPAYRLFARADRRLAGRLGEIKAPVLVVTGEDDSGSTPEMARCMSDAIPNAKCRIIPGVRHMLPVEAKEELNATLKAFLTT